jgi:hypothetical protein
MLHNQLLIKTNQRGLTNANEDKLGEQNRAIETYEAKIETYASKTSKTLFSFSG